MAQIKSMLSDKQQKEKELKAKKGIMQDNENSLLADFDGGEKLATGMVEDATTELSKRKHKV
jgi:hypothetical protein